MQLIEDIKYKAVDESDVIIHRDGINMISSTENRVKIKKITL